MSTEAEYPGDATPDQEIPKRRKGLWWLTSLALGLLSFAALTLVVALRHQPSPYVESDRWSVKALSVTPVRSLENKAASCSLGFAFTVIRQRRQPRLAGHGVAASCMYLTHLEGWPDGENECLLEYPTETVRGVQATSLGARVAERYYSRRQGGLLSFTAQDSERVFLMLDSRWCNWRSVIRGLELVP